jgi:hypothetical protein
MRQRKVPLDVDSIIPFMASVEGKLPHQGAWTPGRVPDVAVTIGTVCHRGRMGAAGQGGKKPPSPSWTTGNVARNRSTTRL